MRLLEWLGFLGLVILLIAVAATVVAAVALIVGGALTVWGVM